MQDYAIKLRHIEKFKKILANYTPSKQLLGLLRKQKFVLLVAPTAAGRNTIIKNLVKNGEYHYVISDTTRPPRTNNGQPEQNGAEYWFKTEEDFLSGLENGNYLESAIIHDQQVSGINITELLQATKSHKIAITDIDINGCNTIQNYSSTVIPLFILPPEYDEWMYRLDSRGKMPEIEKVRRMRSAYDEINNALKISYFKYVTNRDLQQTANTINNCILDDNFNLPDQDIEKNHALALLKELQKVL